MITAGAIIAGGALNFGTVTIDDHSIGDTGVSSATASISYQTGRNVVDQDANVLETWLDAGLSSNYEIRATQTGGVPPSSGTMGQWLPLSTTRTWALTRSSEGVYNSFFTIEIRQAGTTTVLDSAAIILGVEVDGGGGGGGTPPYGGGGGETE